MTNPLILLTNDDGIEAAGLWVAAAALAPLGDLVVVAPDRQWSGAGRAMLREVTGALDESRREILNGQCVRAYGVDATPALCVVHAMTELLPRRPSLLVSGINAGENVSTEITISGTVGAAIEAAAFGVPALAVSLEMAVSEHYVGGSAEDYAVARTFTRRFAQALLAGGLPYDADVLNVNVPRSATAETPWHLTRLSRRRYFVPTRPDRANGTGRPGYAVMADVSRAEPGSDIWALRVAHAVSVTPLSLDLTSRADFGEIEERLRVVRRSFV